MEGVERARGGGAWGARARGHEGVGHEGTWPRGVGHKTGKTCSLTPACPFRCIVPPAPPTATAALQIVTARGGALSRAGEDGRGVAHQPTTVDDVRPDVTALGDAGDPDSDSSDSGSSGDSDGSDGSDAAVNHRRKQRSDRATARLKQLAGGDTCDHTRVVAMRKALVASVAATRRPPRRRTGP